MHLFWDSDYEFIEFWIKLKFICNSGLTLIYPPHFEDVQCQSRVNHIYEGLNNYVSRQVVYHCTEKCMSFV